MTELSPAGVEWEQLERLRPLFAAFEKADMARRIGKGDRAANLKRLIDAQRAVLAALKEQK